MSRNRFDPITIRREAIRYAHGMGLDVECVESVDADKGIVHISVLEAGYVPARMEIHFTDDVSDPRGYYT